MLSEIISLIFPPQCLICSKILAEKVELCGVCSRVWKPRTNQRDISGVSHLSALSYNPSTSRIILLAKEENNAGARQLLAEAIAPLIKTSSNLFIPLPSRKSAMRRRGFHHSFLLAQEVIKKLGEPADKTSRVCDALQIHGHIKDQTGLSREARYQNLKGSMRAELGIFRRIGGFTYRQIYLIDDVVTSGATAREAIRALQSEGITVNAVISACAS